MRFLARRRRTDSTIPRPIEGSGPSVVTASRPLGRRFTGWAAPAATVLLLASASWALIALRDRADTLWSATATLARLEAQVTRQRIAERQALLGRHASASLLEQKDDARRRAREAVAELAQLEEARSLLHQVLRPWTTQAPAAARVRSAFDAYEGAVEEAFRHLAAGRLGLASATGGEATLRFEDLAAVIDGTVTAYTASARLVGNLATGVGTLTVALATLILGGLFLRHRRIRAAAEQMGIEREILRASEERFRLLVQHAADIIAVIENDGTIRHVSPAVQMVLGLSPEKLCGTRGWDLAHPKDVDSAYAFHTDLVREPGTTRSIEIRWRHRDGSWRNVSVKGTNLLNQPGVHGIVLNARDVTEQKALEQQLVHRALHDQLTGLPNRMLFMDRLEHALTRAARGNKNVAVLFLDLDRFKLVNDSFGHDRGDKLLVEVANRLRTCLRQADTIARLGGDEFTLLLEGVTTARDATIVADRIIEAFRRPFSLEGQEVFVSASIGIALGSFGQDASQGLLRNADVAMYRAKANGRAQYEVFKVDMRETVRGQLQIEAELRRAIERGELQVHYQPKVHLETERLVGLEALVRWAHPNRGLIPPGQFIPIAEETGLILPIDRYVLETACRQVKTWRAAGLGDQPLVIAVNLSAHQFRSPRLVEEVARVLADSGLDPDALEIEITESTAMGNASTTAKTLERLKGIGVRLAIDDFGTGYSSLGYLRRFPLDVLKVDRSFVGGLPGNRGDAAIVQAVVALARALGLMVVAEGVETAEQLQELRTLGCDMGQGYYFGKPAPAMVTEALLLQPAPA